MTPWNQQQYMAAAEQLTNVRLIVSVNPALTSVMADTNASYYSLLGKFQMDF